MNIKFKPIFCNLSYTIAANLVSALISAALIVIVPKVLNVTQYGYWQLSVFYSTYVGYMHLGWADGTYLRYGGADYHTLDKSKFKSQFWLLVCMELFITCAIVASAVIFVQDNDKKLIVAIFGFSCFLQIPGTWLRLLLQATNRINIFANNLLIEKGVYGAGILLCMLCRVNSYRPLLLVDICSKFVSTVTLAYGCKDIVFCKGYIAIKNNLIEAKNNLTVGSKLLIANLTSMLIIGVIRIAIEWVWDIDVFGKISLILNISNIFMILINACSVIMYPLLKRMDSRGWAFYYSIVRTILVIFLAGALLVYYPLEFCLGKWLPQYKDSLDFLSLLFPICLYEGKTAMLINTFMKALRMEKQMLCINIFSVLLSSCIAGVVVLYIHNLAFAVLAIVIVLGIRCILGEVVLSGKLELKSLRGIIFEVLLTSLFIWANTNLSTKTSLTFYLTAYLFYVFLEKKEVLKVIRFLTNKSDKGETIV